MSAPIIKIEAPPSPTIKSEAATSSSSIPLPAGMTSANSTASTNPPAAPLRIPDRLARAEHDLQQDTYDVDAWTILLDALPSAASASLNEHIHHVRIVMEQFLAVFPTAAYYWKHWCEQELSVRAYDHVERLFKRCLLEVLDLELWQTYIQYIKVVKHGADDEHESLEQAYEFVLKTMGSDVHAATVWRDYVQFIKNAPLGVFNFW